MENPQLTEKEKKEIDDILDDMIDMLIVLGE